MPANSSNTWTVTLKGDNTALYNDIQTEKVGWTNYLYDERNVYLDSYKLYDEENVN